MCLEIDAYFMIFQDKLTFRPKTTQRKRNWSIILTMFTNDDREGFNSMTEGNRTQNVFGQPVFFSVLITQYRHLLKNTHTYDAYNCSKSNGSVLE